MCDSGTRPITDTHCCVSHDRLWLLSLQLQWSGSQQCSHQCKEARKNGRRGVHSPEGGSDAGAAYIRASKMLLIGHSCTCCQRSSRHLLPLPAPYNLRSITQTQHSWRISLTLCSNYALQPARTSTQELCQRRVPGRTGCSTAQRLTQTRSDSTGSCVCEREKERKDIFFFSVRVTKQVACTLGMDNG